MMEFTSSQLTAIRRQSSGDENLQCLMLRMMFCYLDNCSMIWNYFQQLGIHFKAHLFARDDILIEENVQSQFTKPTHSVLL